jgi:hypothetical protein
MREDTVVLHVTRSVAGIVERSLARGVHELMQTAGRQLRPAMAQPHMEAAQRVEDLRLSIEQFLRDCGEWDT